MDPVTDSMKPATIYDVARHAGVSHQTVTRYLRGYKGIRAETSGRVEAAVRELGYRPNTAARLLRSNRTNRVAVLVQALDQSGPSRIIAGATAVAHRRGYVVDIISVDGGDERSVDAAVALATEHQVAGVLAAAQTDVILDRLRSLPLAVPTVIDAQVIAQGATEEVDESAGRLAADHLVDLGHRQVGYVGGPPAWLAAQARRRGFEHRLAERGVDLAWMLEGDWSASSSHDAVAGLSSHDLAVTAVATANDSMAIGAISALVAAGRRVPLDVSVVGIDDIPDARFLIPSLSTVALDPVGEGELVMGRLLDLIEGVENSHNGAVLRAPLIVPRGSTGRVPA